MLTRRRILAGGTAFAASITVARADEPRLRTVVTLDGQSFTYDAAKGQDLGDFASDIGGFRQRCVKVTHEACPVIVFFRPDRDGKRLEVVFEHGALTDKAPRNLPAYRAEIFSGTTSLAAIDVPKHFWFSRWRWQSAPRPIVGDVKALIAKGALPPYAASKDVGALKPAVYDIMGLAGVTAYMGSTGERPDIGLLTEPQAHYVCTGSRDALAVLRAQAEAAGTLPWHIRDSKTNAPVDLDAFPKMSWYPDRPIGAPHVPLAKTDISIDSAHQPALAYLPYLLTGDPFHLEDLQFAANFNRGTLPPEYRLSIPQTRALAWSLRTLSQAAMVTPTNAPHWLLPRSYWQKDLARTRSWFDTNYVNSRDPVRAVFQVTDNPAGNRADGRSAPEGTWASPWQEEFLACVLGWMVTMGFEEWRPAFQWKIASTIARTDGRSGWVRAYSTPYRLVLRPDKSAPFAKSWGEAWQIASKLAEWPESDPDTIQGKDLTYYTYTRGALAMAVRLGVPAAQPSLTWLDDQLRRRNATIPYRWRIA